MRAQLVQNVEKRTRIGWYTGTGRDNLEDGREKERRYGY